jgi:hypothetical protein
LLWFSSAYYLLAFTTSGESVLFASFSTRAAKTSKEAMIADNGSVVLVCHSPLRTPKKLGTAAIPSQTDRAEAYLVSGATERHPARWPSWGRWFFINSGPTFQDAYRTGRRNVKSIVPDILKVSNFVQILLSKLSKQNGSKHQSQAPKCFDSN